MARHKFTSADDALLRGEYLTRPAHEIAAELGCAVHSVWQRARRIGLLKCPRRRWIDGQLATLRARNAEGWSDAEIAAELGVDRRALCLPWKGSRPSLASNDKGGSHLAHLAQRGLVVRFDRLTGPGRGNHQYRYALALSVERQHTGGTDEDERDRGWEWLAQEEPGASLAGVAAAGGV